MVYNLSGFTLWQVFRNTVALMLLSSYITIIDNVLSLGCCLIITFLLISILFLPSWLPVLVAIEGIQVIQVIVVILIVVKKDLDCNSDN